VRARPRSGSADPGAAPSCRPGGLSPDVARALAAALEEATAKNGGYGGGVLRIDSVACGTLWEGSDGRVAYDDPAPMRVDDAFEVASVTKTFLATVVLQLTEDGVISISEPIARLAPDLFDHLLTVDGRDCSGEITARQLLSHTAGLPDYWSDPPYVADEENAFLHAFVADPHRRWEPRELVAYARELRPFGRPGERYHYSDTGYVLLGLVVERVTGKPLHEVLRQRILRPLGLNDTFLAYRENAPGARRETARYEGHLDVHDQRRQSADWAGGGLVSTTNDLTRFLISLASGRVLHQPSTLQTMWNWAPTGDKDVDYGLGLFRIRLDAGEGQLWGHDGHGNAFAYYWPERGITFTGTLNQTRNDWWPLVSAAMRALDARP
jgi:D-alanyl-D-alanine carboxypeptidase